MAPKSESHPDEALENAAILAAALWHSSRNGKRPDATRSVGARESRWKMEGREEQLDRAPSRSGGSS
jgi:hypothetical protein